MSRFNAKLRRRADEVQTLREFNTEEARIIRAQNCRCRAKRRAEMTQASKLEKLMLHAREHQERGVHCDLWVQRLESTKYFKNNFTFISYLQWNLLKGKTQRQIVAIVEETLCLHCYMILLKSSNSCMKTHCLYTRSDPTTETSPLHPCGHFLQKMAGLTSNWQTFEKAVNVPCLRKNISSYWYIAT